MSDCGGLDFCSIINNMKNYMKCKYGCEEEAKYTLKNGAHVCSEWSTQCLEIRRKNSLAIRAFKKANPELIMRGERHHRCRLGKDPWNKGLTADTDSRVLKNAQEMRKSLSSRRSGGRALTEEGERERRRKISEIMAIKGGGYRRGSGRGKKGWYKGYWCGSSWELAWVIYSLEHGVEFTRCTDRFVYTYDGGEHTYTPDFKVNGTYIEIKGYF